MVRIEPFVRLDSASIATMSVTAATNKPDTSFGDAAFDEVLANKPTFVAHVVEANGLGKGAKFCVAFRRQPLEGLKEALEAYLEALRCDCCSKTLKGLAPLMFAEGASLLKGCEHPLNTDLEACFSKSKLTPLLLTKGTLGTPREGGFDHFFIKVSNFVSPSLGGHDPKRVQVFMDEKVPQLLRVLEENALPGILDSLDVLSTTLKKIPYGDTAWGFTVGWFRAACEDWLAMKDENRTPEAKLLIVLKHLFKPSIKKDAANGHLFCGALNQISDLLKLLAKADDLEFVSGAISHRVAPTNYKRPTAEASESDIDNLVGLLQKTGFGVSLAPLSWLSTVGGWLKRTPEKNPSGGNSLIGFLKNSKPKAKGAAGFAARAGATAFSAPPNFAELLERLLAGEFAKLEVDYSPSKERTIIAKPEGSLVKHPFLWSFLDTDIPGVRAGWVEVVGAIQGPNNFLCVLKGAKPSGLKCPTFPQFLKSEHERQHRRAFDHLTKCPLDIPATEEQLCIGIGTSKSDRDGNAFRPMNFRVTTGDGKTHEVSISKF